MTDNVIQEEIKQNKCKCGCGKVIPEGKEYSQGHYSRHQKQLREEAEKESSLPISENQIAEPHYVLSVLSFELLDLSNGDPDFGLLAWYENDTGERIPRRPVAVGIVYNNLTEERLPYYLISSTDGALIPAPMLPGFIGMFTKYDVERAEREEEMRKGDDKPAEPIALVTQEPKNQPEENRIITAPTQNAPEPKKKSVSFLGTIFGGKEKKQAEAQELSRMLAKIQNNASKPTR